MQSKTSKKTQGENKTSKVKEVMMYNSIVSQSLYLGQRLISDYTRIMNNHQVKKATNEDLIKKGFKPPLKYTFSCSVRRQSCIMEIDVVSPDSKLSAAAANSLVKAFINEQERLMNVKYAQAMHPATLPTSPFLPRKGINLIIGLLGGLLLGIGLAILWDYLDMTIKNPDDLRKMDLLPLGCVPYYPNIPDLYSMEENQITRRGNSILDAIRIINTTISFLKIDNPPKTLQVTSALPSSGKSTQVLLLAKIMGSNNKRVLIVDCDLRKPRIYKNLKLSTSTGLVNYLKDSECDDPNKYINSNIFPNVDIMTHGVVPPNPTELLTSKRFTDTILQLEDYYDCILLDSPPCSGMADAMVLGQSVDAIIIVVETGKTRIHHIARNMEQFDTLREKVLGAILNKVNFKKNSEYYFSSDYYYDKEEKGYETTSQMPDVQPS
jgi:capsular exopolysaccharide synthesis family protein